MALDDISALRIGPDATVRDTINLIDANGRQVAFVTEPDGKLLGIVTDGDIRRGTLRGISLDSPLTEIMNSTPRTASPADSRQTIIDLFTRYGVHHIPIIDDAGVAVGLFTLDDLVRPKVTTTPVVLMAGGKGQRLGELTKETPKPMLDVGGMPLLERIVRNLRSQGFVNIFISVNYLAEQIEKYFGDGSPWGLSIEYVHEDKPLGTAGALAALNGRMTEPFVVMNGDLLTKVSLRDMLEFHVETGARGTLGAREHVVNIPYGVVDVDKAMITSMAEKPDHVFLVNTGIYVLDPVALGYITPGEFTDMPVLLQRVMDDGHPVAAFPIHDAWLDVGLPEELQRARADARRWSGP